jgi:phytoene synthase
MLDAPPRPDMRAAERFCEDMARREAANFYWGFIALPRQQRIAIYALYDFARQVDDDADLDGRASRDVRLEHHRRRLHEARPGDTTDPVMSVLAVAMRRYSIPMAELDMLIDGVAMDLITTRYRTWDELVAYANLVASVIGRMCVRIFGFRDPVALERADELGIALQLINILRDVREDAARGRIYLPADELEAYGITEEHILEGRAAPGWNRFMAMQAARARTLHASGLRVTESIPTQPGVCVRTMAGIYLGILDRIEATPELPLRGRARLSKAAKIGVMARSWLAAV